MGFRREKVMLLGYIPAEFYWEDNPVTHISGGVDFVRDLDKFKLKNCPFCGSSDLELSNTHTPYYEIECQDCGCSKETLNDYKHFKTLKRTVKEHEESVQNVINLWQQRA